MFLPTVLPTARFHVENLTNGGNIAWHCTPIGLGLIMNASFHLVGKERIANTRLWLSQFTPEIDFASLQNKKKEECGYSLKYQSLLVQCDLWCSATAVHPNKILLEVAKLHTPGVFLFFFSRRNKNIPAKQNKFMSTRVQNKSMSIFCFRIPYISYTVRPKGRDH